MVGNLPFFFFLFFFSFFYLRAIPKYKPPGAYIGLEGGGGGGLTEDFCVTSLGGLYMEGHIFGILLYAVSSVSIA